MLLFLHVADIAVVESILKSLPFLPALTKSSQFYNTNNITNLIILLFKVFFYRKLNISINTEPIGFSILGKLHIGLGMVLSYF